MVLIFKNFKIFTEQGIKVPFNKSFRKVPFIGYFLLRKLVKFEKQSIKKFEKNNLFIFKTNLKICLFLKYYNIKIYNGRNFSKFSFSSAKKFKIIGQFINTRVLNFGKILHLRKKSLKKKK